MTDNKVANFDILIEQCMKSIVICNKALGRKRDYENYRIDFFKSQILINKIFIKELNELKHNHQ